MIPKPGGGERELGIPTVLDRLIQQALLQVLQPILDPSATNNGSERALRPCAVYREITNGFRSAWAATLYADVRSAVETARRRKVRAIDAIRLTLSGEPIPKTA